MKQNNKLNNFEKNNFLEKNIFCSCEAKVKSKSCKNYPFDRKFRAITSQDYQYNEYEITKFINEKQKGGVK